MQLPEENIKNPALQTQAITDVLIAGELEFIGQGTHPVFPVPDL